MSRILRVVSGPDLGRIFPITHFPIVVGQDPNCDVCLTSPDVGMQHAVLEEVDGVLLVRDLGADSGTLLNGNAVTAEILNPGDTLAFGSTEVLFWVQRGAAQVSYPRLGKAGPNDKLHGVSSPYIPALQDAQEIHVKLSGAEVSALFAAQVPASAADPDALERSQRSLAAVYEINTVLGTTFDLETVLARVLDITLATVDGDRGVVLLTEGSEGQTMRVSRRHPGRSQDTGTASLKISRTIVQHVLATGEAVLTTDAASDSRFQAEDSVLSLNIRAAMCVPLPGRHEPLGVIHVDAGDRAVFTEESLRLLACIADIAGKVIENARLYQASLDAERLAAVGETVAGTAHYMKNLLTGLMAGAELVDLGLESADSDAVASGWSPIRKNLDILSDLVLNMLDYSRDRQPVLQAMQPAELLSDLADLVRHRAEGRNIQLDMEVIGDVPPLRVDPVGLHRALLNVLTNALDAIPEAAEGRVSLRASSSEHDIVLEVIDTGTGIPESILPGIFDLFCTTKGSRGTGFGLAVTKKIVEEHGGRLEVETVVGSGTTIRVLLPR